MNELNPKTATEALCQHFENAPQDEIIAELRKYWPDLTVVEKELRPIDPLVEHVVMTAGSVSKIDAFQGSIATCLYEEVRPLEDPDLKSDTDKKLRTAIDTIPDKYRQIIVFRLLESMSCKDIAEALNIPPARAQRMVCRALAHLWLQIAPWMVDAKDRQAVP